MGIRQKIRKFTGSGEIKEGCKFDQNTGQFRCEKRRVNEDKTEEVLGVVSGQLDGGCNVVLDEQWQIEDGVVDSLNRKFVDRIKGKCQSKPQDY